MARLLGAAAAAAAVLRCAEAVPAHSRMGNGTSPPPMNGEYPGIANGLPGFKPKHRGEWFEVYAHEVTTRYSEVFWTAQPAIDLPPELVSRFAGRAISITGFEVDIVRVDNATGKETSVPSYEWYNHHWCVTITGGDAQMVYVGPRTHLDGVQRRAIEVHPPEWEPRSVPTAAWSHSVVPTAQNFWQGNGNEHRKSFKHLPQGYGQMVESPRKFVLQPMLINTKAPAGQRISPLQPKARGRDGGGGSMAPPGANYSGLMECPCTTRVTKVIHGYATQNSGRCAAGKGISTAQECFAAAAQMVSPLVRNVSVSDDRSPAGCFLVASSGAFESHFNIPPSGTGADCGRSGGGPARATGSEKSYVHLSLDLDGASGNATITITGPDDKWFGVGFGATVMADQPYTITVSGTGEVTERKIANHAPGTVLPPTVTVISNSVAPAKAEVRMSNHWGSPWTQVAGGQTYTDCEHMCDANSTCKAWTYFPPKWSTPYNLDLAGCVLRWGLSSPDGRSSGFTNSGWVDGMYSGEKGVTQRTVTLSRALKGRTADYFTFDPTATGVPFINAVGQGAEFAFHGDTRGGATLMLVEAGAPVCVCRGNKSTGSINGLPWSDNCQPYPATTIARDHNPSCDIHTYGGGMICCHHGVHLLDADQEVPPETDTVQMKYRFYFEEPTPNLTRSAFFMFREVEQNHGEYDVTRCPDGTPPEQCVHTIEGRFQLKEAMRPCHDRSDVWCAPSMPKYPQADSVRLLHISPHCHGPACISLEIINADTNETLCRIEPVYGKGDGPMDESGYAVGIPPCIWGTAAEGLPPPPVLSLDTNILAIKRANNSIYHYGVMAHLQMRAAWNDGPPDA
eukprot:TRINITY_DN4407_c0_g2_i1.p1 TRINITY_DN4407_c0_g2~~TRINITY_DN4407_c0_g2_i1.p1  ORF type:complete len:883 (+),score=253.05 TRINITY_DN4407_c0_g2_i1:102-2651(+)